MAILHVLNGDATLVPFRDSGLSGDIVIDRMMMSEGKTTYTADMDAFFTARADHAQNSYGIDRQTYLTQVVQEFARVQDAAHYDEVVLWFEFDLFCQVNLLFTLFYMQQFKLPAKISLVSPDSHPNTPNFKGLGMLSAAHFPALFEQRLTLQSSDLQTANQIWAAYCSSTPLTLETFAGQPAGQLYHIGKALQAHLQRLPAIENGLNRIENFFLNLLAMADYRWYDLYSQFWNQLTVYGFGDFQLDVYMRGMISTGVIEEDGQLLSITSLGKEILNGEENYLAYAPRKERFLGGVPLQDTPWRWDQKAKKVVKV